jgi:transcription-repair coupling factor (superfamily II helicase)
LGFEQHGNINTVGLHLYQQILDDVLIKRGLKEDKKQKEESEEAIRVEIKGFQLNCVLTDLYIANQIERMKIYRKIAISRTLDDIGSVERELADRFGPLEPNALELLLYSRIRILADALGVKSIEALKRSRNVRFSFTDRQSLDRFEWQAHRGFSNRETLEVLLFEIDPYRIAHLLENNFTLRGSGGRSARSLARKG